VKEKLTFLLLAMMISFTAWIVYLFLLEPPPVTYTNLPFPTASAKVNPGEVIPLKIRRCSSQDKIILATLTRTLENMEYRDFVSLPSTITQIQPGCTENISHTNRVPENIQPGVYRVVGVAEVAGTLRNHNVVYFSEPFVVTNK